MSRSAWEPPEVFLFVGRTNSGKIAVKYGQVPQGCIKPCNQWSIMMLKWVIRRLISPGMIQTSRVLEFDCERQSMHWYVQYLVDTNFDSLCFFSAYKSGPLLVIDWSCNLYKWPCKWAPPGVISLLIGNSFTLSGDGSHLIVESKDCFISSTHYSFHSLDDIWSLLIV